MPRKPKPPPEPPPPSLMDRLNDLEAQLLIVINRLDEVLMRVEDLELARRGPQ